MITANIFIKLETKNQAKPILRIAIFIDFGLKQRILFPLLAYFIDKHGKLK